MSQSNSDSDINQHNRTVCHKHKTPVFDIQKYKKYPLQYFYQYYLRKYGKSPVYHFVILSPDYLNEKYQNVCIIKSPDGKSVEGYAYSKKEAKIQAIDCYVKDILYINTKPSKQNQQKTSDINAQQKTLNITPEKFER